METGSRELLSKYERSALIRAGCGLAIAAIVLFWLFDGPRIVWFLAVLSATALIGGAVGRGLGYNIYLILNLGAEILGKAVSFLMVVIIYMLGIGVFGSLLRLVGMDRLQRDWQENRLKTSMFVHPPKTTKESLRRQS
ncbi:MAG: hypothetical protein HY913_13445 [Desulfomonile tiedjei]|nr:hypothetical protein [Desulfomonile tiedjei]